MSSPSHKNNDKPQNLLPLYKNENNDTPNNKPADANTGLWFERFFDQFNADASGILESKTINGDLKQGNNFWLQKFKNAGNADALEAAAMRQMDLVKQLNGRHKFFNSQWHFVTGTGYPHPVENGLAWHRTYGVPYLSGAAVKGLLRAWIEHWEEFATEEKRKQRLLSWFGSESKQSTANQAGDIIFFDALPVREVALVTDIMTPHYGQWYSDGGKITDIAKQPEKIPADWHDPIPIPFLVVDKATSYLFSFAPRNALAVERVKMDEVIECLTNAMEWLGAGAKTATGYGGFINQTGIHSVEKQWLAAIQSLDEDLAAMTEDQIIDAFSKDYTATKAARLEKGHDWAQVITVIWQQHETTILNWADSQHKNTKKAFKKLLAEKEQLR